MLGHSHDLSESESVDITKRMLTLVTACSEKSPAVVAASNLTKRSPSDEKA